MSVEQIVDCKEFTGGKSMDSVSGPCGGGPGGACQGACRGCRTEVISVEPKGFLAGKVGRAELPVRGLK